MVAPKVDFLPPRLNQWSIYTRTFEPLFQSYWPTSGQTAHLLSNTAEIQSAPHTKNGSCIGWHGLAITSSKNLRCRKEPPYIIKRSFRSNERLRLIIKDVLKEDHPDIPAEQFGNYMTVGRQLINRLCPHRAPLPESEIRIALRELFQSQPVGQNVEKEAALRSIEIDKARAFIEHIVPGILDDILDFEAVVLANEIVQLALEGRWPKDKKLAERMRQWIYRKRWRKIERSK